MTVDLPDRLRAFIAAKIASGRFADETAAITYIVERWMQWEADAAGVRKLVDRGVEAAEAQKGSLVKNAEEASDQATLIKEFGRKRHKP